MHIDHDKFLQAIKEAKKIRLYFADNLGDLVIKEVVPLDYIPGKRVQDKGSCYHFWDPELGANGSPLVLFKEQIKSMEIDHQTFDFNEFIDFFDTHRAKRKFFIKRDWGGVITDEED